MTTKISGRMTSTSVYSVSDFGAKGDGVADDTAAIQAAIDAVSTSGGGSVLVPPGVFLLGALPYYTDAGPVYGAHSIKMKDNVHLRGLGPGSVLKVKNGAYGGGAFYRAISSRDGTMLSNARISDLTVDGNKSNQIASVQCSNIVLECLSDVAVERVRSINSNGNGIMVRGTTTTFGTNLAVRDCVVNNCSAIGIQSSQFFNLTITGNRVSATTDNGIDVYGEDGTTVVHASEFLITNNVVHQSSVGVFCETVGNGVVQGNTVNTCLIGYVVNRINGQPIGISFTGNRSNGCNYDYRVTGDTGGIKIHGNSGNGASAACVQLGAGGGNCSYVEVTGNTFTPASGTVPIISTTGANQVSFCTGKLNTVISATITQPYLYMAGATISVVNTFDSFKVLPNQIGRDLYGYDAEMKKLTLLNASVDNTSGPVDIPIDDHTGGQIIVTADKAGVGTSTWVVPFIKKTTLVLGTSQKAILTADPITSLTVVSNNARLTLGGASTYVKYAVQYTPTA